MQTTDAEAASSPIRGAARPVTRQGRGCRGIARLGRRAGMTSPPSASISVVSRAASGCAPAPTVGAAGDHSAVAAVGDQPAAADHDQVVGGHGHLVHQVAGDQDGAALAGQVLHQVPDPQDALGVQPVDRLVQQQHLRVAEHRRRDAQPLAHAQRERPGPLARHLAQPDQVEHLVHPAGAAGPGVWARNSRWLRALRPGCTAWPPAARRPSAAGRAVGVALAVDGGDAACGRSRPRMSRIVVDLPAPFGPEEPGDPARLDRERQVVYGDLAPVALGQLASLDHDLPVAGKDLAGPRLRGDSLARVQTSKGCRVPPRP